VSAKAIIETPPNEMRTATNLKISGFDFRIKTDKNNVKTPEVELRIVEDAIDVRVRDRL
jgi:hypothetical protein